MEVSDSLVMADLWSSFPALKVQAWIEKSKQEAKRRKEAFKEPQQ